MVDAATSVKFGTWNVRSMVDTAGCVEVASRHAGRGEDCKVDLVISEQARYVIVVGSLQETKWFGNEVYEVADSVVLTSGRRTPMHGDRQQRRGGCLEETRKSGAVETVRGVICTVCDRLIKLKETYLDHCSFAQKDVL